MKSIVINTLILLSATAAQLHCSDSIKVKNITINHDVQLKFADDSSFTRIKQGTEKVVAYKPGNIYLKIASEFQGKKYPAEDFVIERGKEAIKPNHITLSPMERIVTGQVSEDSGFLITLSYDNGNIEQWAPGELVEKQKVPMIPTIYYDNPDSQERATEKSKMKSEKMVL